MLDWVIEEEFRVHYHPGHVCRLLHQLGFSGQRPRRRLARADLINKTVGIAMSIRT